MTTGIMQTSPETTATAVNDKPSPPLTPCWGYVALWGFVWLCWLTTIAVDVFVTPGGDWLRHNDKSINWFTVGGGDEDVFGGCDVRLFSSHWCSSFAIFTVMQTTASILVSVAAVLLLIATCLSRPHRWCISSGIFFAIYAALQAAVIGLVVTTARKLEDALVGDGASSEASGRAALPSLSLSSSSSSSVPTEIEHGTTLLLGFCCGVVGFNASLMLFALSRQAPPEVDPLCGCLCRLRRRDEKSRRRTTASTTGSGTNSLRGSRAHSRRGSRTDNTMGSPTALATGQMVGAAANILRVSRQPLAAPTHPRPSSGSAVDAV